ncbi:MAG: TonB-dependent receptor, partial [Candidatus Sulfotelmatobacter sp.]
MRRTVRDSVVIGMILAAALFLATTSSAQVSKGSISGTVVDPTGAAVVGAEAKAVSVETNQSSTTATDNSGLFKLPLLAVGTYRLEISKSGFRKASLVAIDVTPGVDTGLGTIKLEVGAATETVEVSAATPLIETTQSQITNSFSSTDMSNLPGIQENEGLDNLAILLPGVSMSRDLGLSNSNGVDFSVDGLRGRNNDQQIDGQNNNDNSVAGPGLFLSDTEFVDQYQVTTNNFGPEYGRNAGSVVNIITKSGGNVWHGSVYGTESNSALTSLTNQQENTVWGEGLTKPPRFNDEFTGATIGGPWVKNKVFFFGGFDNEIVSSKTVDGSGNLTPTLAGLAQLGGCFPGSASVAALAAYGPYGVGGGGPTTLGPLTTTDYTPLILADAGLVVPVPNDGASGCNVQESGVQRTLGDGSHSYNWVSRLDVTGSKDTVYFRYLFNKSTFFNVDEGQAASGYPVNVPALSQQLGASWTHKITNQMLNELRASVGRQNVQFGGNTIGNTVPTDQGVESALADVTFAETSLLGFGPLDSFPQGRIVNTYQIQDNWSYVRGKHQFKAGANLTLQKSPNTFLPNGNGFFQFTDWGFFAANTPNFTSITLGSPKLDFIEHDSFFYFGDDWKVTNHLTLNLGLTYSYYGQPADLFHNND